MAPVHDAAYQNDVEKLRRLLEEEPGLLEAEGNGGPGARPLHLACHAGSMEAAGYLLDRGAGIDCRDRDGGTPLTWACSMGRVETVRLLLARGVDPALADQRSMTALMWASTGGEQPGSDYVAVTRLLLEDGRVPVNARNKNGETALLLACSQGHTERARVLLLEGRADLSIADMWDTKPMARARQGLYIQHDETVRLLEWYEGELQRAFLLSKARAVVDAAESISRAPEKVGARTEVEAQRAREQAAPAYLRRRVELQEALPSVEVVGEGGGADMEEEEREAVYEFIVRHMKGDLCVDLAEGVRLR